TPPISARTSRGQSREASEWSTRRPIRRARPRCSRCDWTRASILSVTRRGSATPRPHACGPPCVRSSLHTSFGSKVVTRGLRRGAARARAPADGRPRRSARRAGGKRPPSVRRPSGAPPSAAPPSGRQRSAAAARPRRAGRALGARLRNARRAAARRLARSAARRRGRSSERGRARPYGVPSLVALPAAHSGLAPVVRLFAPPAQLSAGLLLLLSFSHSYLSSPATLFAGLRYAKEMELQRPRRRRDELGHEPLCDRIRCGVVGQSDADARGCDVTAHRARVDPERACRFG